VSAQIKNDNAYWGNCVIRAHLSDPDSPYEIFCRTTNEVYRLRRRQVSINETEVKNLRSQKLLPSNHVDPLVSPHCDSEVLRTNVGLSNSEENRKRRRKPKDFGADWIIPGNPRKRVKSDCIRVNDNNDLAGRLKGDEIVSSGLFPFFRRCTYHEVLRNQPVMSRVGEIRLKIDNMFVLSNECVLKIHSQVG
ncbi:unnamed protein product, partial [Trichobilharzia szidati]